MATPVLNSAFLTKERIVELSNDLESLHIKSLISSDPDDLGVFDIWALSNMAESPLYNLASFKGKNEILVQDRKGRYKYEVPVYVDAPHVVEDIEPSNTQKGIAGTTFRLKFNRKGFTNGQIITYNKFNGPEVYITSDDIIDAGDGYIYTCKLVNNGTFRFLDNRYLKPSIKWFVKASVIGEKSTRFPGFVDVAGYREYMNFVGGAETGFRAVIDRDAANVLEYGVRKMDGKNLDILELFRVPQQFLQDDPTIKTFDDLKRKMGADAIKNALKSGAINYTFLTKLEARGLMQIQKDIENYLMWGRGGIVQTDSPEVSRLSVGLWAQTDNSFKVGYTKSMFTLDYFRSLLRNFYYGRESLKGPESDRNIIVQTGQGGFELINRAITTSAQATGFLIAAAENQGIGAIKGQGFNLEYGYYFTKYKIPFLANIEFVYNPALDNFQMVNEEEMPLVDGFPLSSYSFLIWDVTQIESENILLLKYGPDHQLSWYYKNGTMDYLGRKSGFQSQSDRFGCELTMRQRYPAIVVKDPTKILKLVMKHPTTGFML